MSSRRAVPPWCLAVAMCPMRREEAEPEPESDPGPLLPPARGGAPGSMRAWLPPDPVDIAPSAASTGPGANFSSDVRVVMMGRGGGLRMVRRDRCVPSAVGAGRALPDMMSVRASSGSSPAPSP